MTRRARSAAGAILTAFGGLAFPAVSLAQETGISSVELEAIEADSGLRAQFGSRYMIVIELGRPVDVANCPAAESAGVRVVQVAVVESDRADPTPRTFYPGARLASNSPCGATRLMTPLTVSPDEPLLVTVQLSSGEILVRSDVRFPSEAHQAAESADRVVQSEFAILYGQDSGRLGLSWSLNGDLTLLGERAAFLARFDEATLTFRGETAADEGSLDFKETVELETRFVSRFGPVGDYYAIVLEPIAFQADDDFRNITYRGSAAFALEVPFTQDLARSIRPLFGGCQQGPANCTAFGLIASLGYAANVKVAREDGVVDRSDDFMTVAEAVWNFPLSDRIRFNARYEWQSESPDGSSSESSEVGFTFQPTCQNDLGLTVSWIDGEFMPGQQRREALRFGLTRVFGRDASGCD